MPDGPKQKEVAAKSGVDQGLVSRILNRRIKRWTERVEKIAYYVNMQEQQRGAKDHSDLLSKKVHDAVDAYLRSGCDVDLLCQQVAVLQTAQLHRR